MRAENREAQWLRQLIPLPHEIAIEDEITCRPEEVSIRLQAGAGPVEQQAAAELERLFAERAGVAPGGGGFEIVLGVADAEGRLGGVEVDVQRLKGLPHQEQAYLIQPRGREGLVLAGLGERGVYYAARTLHQLLESTLSREGVAIPLVRVVDWPDMDERGIWNFPDPEEWIRWMSAVKLNYGKMASTTLKNVERGKPNSAAIDKEFLEEGLKFLLIRCSPADGYPAVAVVVQLGENGLFGHQGGDSV